MIVSRNLFKTGRLAKGEGKIFAIKDDMRVNDFFLPYSSLMTEVHSRTSRITFELVTSKKEVAVHKFTPESFVAFATGLKKIRDGAPFKEVKNNPHGKTPGKAKVSGIQISYEANMQKDTKWKVQMYTFVAPIIETEPFIKVNDKQKENLVNISIFLSDDEMLEISRISDYINKWESAYIPVMHKSRDDFDKRMMRAKEKYGDKYLEKEILEQWNSKNK